MIERRKTDLDKDGRSRQVKEERVKKSLDELARFRIITGNRWSKFGIFLNKRES
jgi:hypothetical protein